MRVTRRENVALYLSGQPVPVRSGNFSITPPTIKDIAVHGEKDFLIAVNFLSKANTFMEEVRASNPQIAMLSEFQILLVILQEQENMRRTFLSLLELILPDYEVSIEQGLINLKVDGRVVGQINPRSYDEFKEVVRDLALPIDDPRQDDYKPVNEVAAKIAEKLRKGRERIAAQRSDGDENASLFGSYVSVLSVGLNMDMNVLLNYKPFQIIDSFTRFFAKAESDRYEKLCMTPMMDTSKLKEVEPWVRNIYKG